MARSSARILWRAAVGSRGRDYASCGLSDGPVYLPRPWYNVVESAVRRLPVYAALSYDGRIEMTPADETDAKIASAVNAHQRTDKGFGPALGPDAARQAITRFERVDYVVVQGASDWVFTPQDREIQLEILSGWAAAARETGLSLPEVADWLARRRGLVAAGRSSIRVGHVDFFARPTGMR